jgi:hypothetical protein
MRVSCRAALVKSKGGFAAFEAGMRALSVLAQYEIKPAWAPAVGEVVQGIEGVH